MLTCIPASNVHSRHQESNDKSSLAIIIAIIHQTLFYSSIILSIIIIFVSIYHISYNLSSWRFFFSISSSCPLYIYSKYSPIAHHGVDIFQYIFSFLPASNNKTISPKLPLLFSLPLSSPLDYSSNPNNSTKVIIIADPSSES